MNKIRIFISSPGDVQQERVIAKKVISELNNIYREYVVIETIMWEDLPLSATASSQDGINYFLEEKIRDRETGASYAYTQFDKQQTFDERLKIHLTRLIKDQIGEDIVVREWASLIREAAEQYAQSANSSTVRQVFCPHCGKPAHEGAAFCLFTGMKL